MARIFITGSADGLGQLAAKELVGKGHEVVLHARNTKRAEEALKNVPGAAAAFTADLSNMDETKELVAKINASGKFDVVIHNAGVYQVSNELIFSVNTLAPYILTCLVQRPKRLIYLSSGMHLQGNADMENLSHNISRKKYPGYSDSKLHDLILSMAVARKWNDVYSNTVDPGWVPTKMGGHSATDNLEEGFHTQVWLAISEEKEAKVSGHYFYHKKQSHFLPTAGDTKLQDRFIEICEQITGVTLPD